MSTATRSCSFSVSLTSTALGTFLAPSSQHQPKQFPCLAQVVARTIPTKHSGPPCFRGWDRTQQSTELGLAELLISGHEVQTCSISVLKKKGFSWLLSKADSGTHWAFLSSTEVLLCSFSEFFNPHLQDYNILPTCGRQVYIFPSGCGPHPN